MRPSLCRLACPRSYDRQHIFMSGSHYIFFEDSSVTDFPLKEVAPEGTPPASCMCTLPRGRAACAVATMIASFPESLAAFAFWIGRAASADSTESMLQRAAPITDLHAATGPPAAHLPLARGTFVCAAATSTGAEVLARRGR